MSVPWQIKLQIFFRVRKQKLLDEIGIALGVPANDVSAKIHTLRTQFNRECARERKTKSGSSADGNYVSKWEHMSSLQFLKISAVDSVTISNLVIIYRLIYVGIVVTLYRYSFQNLDLCDDVSSDTCSEMETIVLTSDSSDTQSEYSGPSSSSSNKRPRLPTAGSKKAPKKRNTESTTDDILLEKALAIMNEPNDEFEIFGRFVASEMRQIRDISTRNFVKSEILKTLLNCGNINPPIISTHTENLPLQNEILSTNEDNVQYIYVGEEPELFT